MATILIWRHYRIKTTPYSTYPSYIMGTKLNVLTRHIQPSETAHFQWLISPLTSLQEINLHTNCIFAYFISATTNFSSITATCSPPSQPLLSNMTLHLSTWVLTVTRSFIICGIIHGGDNSQLITLRPHCETAVPCFVRHSHSRLRTVRLLRVVCVYVLSVFPAYSCWSMHR